MESAVAARLTEVGPCQVCLAREGMSRLKGLGGWPMLSSGRKSGWPALLAFFARGRGFWSRSMTTRLEDFVFLVVTACSSVTARVLTRKYSRSMPWGLKRYQQAGGIHFVTFRCYHRAPLLETAYARYTFVTTLEKVRSWYGFYVTGFVVMPEHAHLLFERTGARHFGCCLANAQANCFIQTQ